MSGPIEYKGKTYRSLYALHKAFGAPEVGYLTFKYRVKADWPVEKALTHPPRRYRDKKATPIEYEGKKYRSIAALYNELSPPSLSYHSFYARWKQGIRGKDLAAPKAWKAAKIQPFVDGVRYSSLAHLAKALGISYSTVYRRWRRGWSDQEIAYGQRRKKKKKIKTTSRKEWLKKLEIEFRGKTYKNKSELCHAHGIRPTTFRDRHQKRGYTIAQALGVEPLPDKRIGSGGNSRPIRFRGKSYCSQKALAEAFQVSPHLFHSRMSRGNNLEQALGLSEQPSYDRQPISITANGQTFKSISACAKKFGVKRNTLARRLRRGWTPEQAVGVESPPAGIKVEVVCDGVTYPSISALAKAFNLADYVVRDRLSISGYTPEQAVGIDASRTYLQETVVGGKVYRSFSDACYVHRINDELARKRVKFGWSLEQALDLEKEPNSTEIAFRGETFDSIADLGRRYGLSNETILSRRSMGWSMEEALGLVDREPQHFGRYNERYFTGHPDQKTKACSLYLIELQDKKHDENYFKIGITTVTIAVRMSELSSSEIVASVLAEIELELYSAWQLEQMLHDEFSDTRFTPEHATFGGRTECFRFDEDQVKAVTNLINEFGEIRHPEIRHCSD